MTPTGSTPPRARAAATRYGYLVAAALAGVYAFNFLDRQFLTVLQEPVKRELHLSDTQLGALTGTTFAVFYTVCGVPIGALADRANRVRIVAIASGVWSLFTALSGMATSFAALAAARVGVGVGEAGGSPPSYSILSDYFPPHKRATALAVYALGVPVGGTLGIIGGGLIAAAYGWRAAFWALGAAGLALTPLIPLLVREPARGAFDAPAERSGAAPGAVGSLALFARSPVLMLTAAAAGLTAFVGYGMLNWTPSLLMRSKGMSLSQFALWYALVSGVMNVAGTLLSGLVVDRLAKRSPAAYALVPGVATLLVTPFLWGAALSPGWPAALVFLAVPALLNNVYLAPAIAVVQNGVPSRSRSAAGALLLFALNFVGLGGGPLFVGAVSDALKPQYGAQALPYAMLALTPVFGLAFLCQLAAARLLHRTRPVRHARSEARV